MFRPNQRLLTNPSIYLLKLSLSLSSKLETLKSQRCEFPDFARKEVVQNDFDR